MSKIKKSSTSALITYFFLISAIFTPYTKAEINAKLSDGKNLKLIGIGIHQELRNDIYVGALYGPLSTTDAESLLDVNLSKRMSIRFIAKYANRKLSRHWKERLALNNHRDKWQPLTREIIQFSDIFKSNFEVGDELNIDYLAGVGTQIYLNGTLFKTINTPGFYNLLLNVWLGTNPPTKAFKNSIRGLDEDSLRNKMIGQYQGLVALAGRFDQDLVESKSITTAAPKETVKVAIKDTPKENPVKVAAINTKETEKKVTNVAVDKSKEIESDSIVNIENKAKEPIAQDLLTNKKIDNAVIANNTNSATKNTSNNLQSPSAANNKELLSDTTKPTELSSSLIGTHTLELAKIENIQTVIANDNIKENISMSNPSESYFDADLASGSYTRDLINAVRNYQEYPRQALIDGDQGLVVLMVTINSAGEILNTEFIEKSGSRTLDRAVLKMVNKASPFQAIPPELKLKTFDFEIPIEFKL